MIIDFSSQTYTNILTRQLADVTNSIDKREGSLIYTALGPESYEFEGLYINLNTLQDNSFTLTAKGDALDLKVAERGIYRRPATAATREAIFDVTVPLNARFSTIDGENSVIFYVSESRGRGSDGYFHYYVICETTGQIGNQYTGELLPVTFIANLTLAQLTDIIIAGTDAEDDDSIRERYVLSLTEQAFGGNIASYREYILSQGTAGAVQIYPASEYKGGGTVLCSVLDGNFDRATEQLISDLQILICPPEVDQSNPSAKGYGLAPIGAQADITTGTNFDVNVEMTLQLQAGYSEAVVRPDVEAAVNEYLLSVRRSWGSPLLTNKVQYPVYVYASQITVRVLAITGVVNVTNVLLNNTSDDLELTENSTLQEIPVTGTVTIYVEN